MAAHSNTLSLYTGQPDWVKKEVIAMTEFIIVNVNNDESIILTIYKSYTDMEKCANLQTMFVLIFSNLCKFLDFARNFLCKTQKKACVREIYRI